MGVVRKTISLSEEQDNWVKAKVASGRFASESEVHRALIERQFVLEAKRKDLKDMLQAGLESGTSPRSFDEIVESGRARALAKIGKGRQGAA